MSTPPDRQTPDFFRNEARSDFDSAHRKSTWRSILSWVTRNQVELLPFDEVRTRLPVKGQHYTGMREVPLDAIIGSVSRYNDFDRAFLPRQTHTRDRWENVDSAHLQDIILPPIEVYQIGDAYFVKDGNHRVSVARLKGQAYIDAYVIRLDVPVEIEPDLDLNMLALKQEEGEFLEKTRLKEYRPDAEVQLTIPGMYTNLLDHIRVHRWYMGEKIGGNVSEQEAVVDWYDAVYIPLVEIIRRQKILRQFPDRTESDLYLWIIEHRWYLQEEYNTSISLEMASRDFVDRFKRGPIARFFTTIACEDPQPVQDEIDQQTPGNQQGLIFWDIRSDGLQAHPEVVGHYHAVGAHFHTHRIGRVSREHARVHKTQVRFPPIFFKVVIGRKVNLGDQILARVVIEPEHASIHIFLSIWNHIRII